VRIARFARGGEVAYGIIEDQGNGASGGQGAVVAELHGHPFGADPESLRFTGARYPVPDVRLLAPVLPSKVVAVDGNYPGASGASSAGATSAAQADPVLFLKPSTSVAGPQDPIAYPVKLTERVEHEGELAVIIGRLCRDVPPHRAPEVIFGYACANDITARDLAERDKQWTRAKGFDTFCPLGPWIETEADPADLEIITRVNGEVRQQARTSQMLTAVPALIAYVSQIMTLLPGDVLLTGSPAGAGPLTDGDEVSVTIGRIGTLTNRVVARD
jgi:2-keto-4-pentenoate hydratase/2-oxohepta-3-ene-1,7-dioic acid hydratase in catechol pathway